MNLLILIMLNTVLQLVFAIYASSVLKSILDRPQPYKRKDEIDMVICIFALIFYALLIIAVPMLYGAI